MLNNKSQVNTESIRHCKAPSEGEENSAIITSTGRMTSLKNCLNYILGGGRGQPIRVVDDTQQFLEPLGSGLVSKNDSHCKHATWK